MRERRGGRPAGQRFRSERREKKKKKKEEEEVTETDAEHENGLCHPFSNTEPENKGSVSCFFHHLLDDNSYLSPHQRQRRGERRKHTKHCTSCLFLFTRVSSPSSSVLLFFPPPPSLSQHTNTLEHSFSPSACHGSK